MSRDAHLAVTVSTKFEVDTTIHCLVINSVIAADTLRDLVTLTFDLLTLVSGHTYSSLLVPTKTWLECSLLGAMANAL